MGNFRDDRGNRGPSPRRDFGRRSFGGDRNRGGRDRQMFKATCSNCGKECEVPFRPTNTKPVYCSDCFEKMGGGRSNRPDNRPSSENSRPQGGNRGDGDQNRAQFENLNRKLDRIISLLEPVATKKPQTPAPAKEMVKQVEVKEPETPVVVKEEVKVEKIEPPEGPATVKEEVVFVNEEKNLETVKEEAKPIKKTSTKKVKKASTKSKPSEE